MARKGTWKTWIAERVYLRRIDGPGGADFIDYGPDKTGPGAASRPDNCACCGNRTARYMRRMRDGSAECSGCLGYVRD
jgi:hypothetical protein